MGSCIYNRLIQQYSTLTYIGMDISPHMVAEATVDIPNKGFIVGDMGCALPFKTGMFDFIISVSALQWLFHSYKKCDDIEERLRSVFSESDRVLTDEGVAVFQFYLYGKDVHVLLEKILRRLRLLYKLIENKKRVYLILWKGLQPEGTQGDKVLLSVFNKKIKRTYY